MSKRRCGVAAACLIALMLAFGACKSSPPPLPGGKQNSNLTPGMVKRTIQKGETSQVEILHTFGAPNIVTTDQEGREVWAYDVQSTSHASAETEVSGGAGVAAAGLAGTVPIGGAVSGSAGRTTSAGQVSSTTFTLTITFNENDIVQDYRMMSTQF